jgi:hypothetical protein
VLHQQNVGSPDPKYGGKHCPCKKCQQQAIDATRFRNTYRLIEFRSASDPDAEDEDEDDKYWEYRDFHGGHLLSQIWLIGRVEK